MRAVSGIDTILFLSTPSARRATLRRFRDSQGTTYFYPRPPRGGRPAVAVSVTSIFLFLSTPSARRATTVRMRFSTCSWNFYPRPPRGGRP